MSDMNLYQFTDLGLKTLTDFFSYIFKHWLMKDSCNAVWKSKQLYRIVCVKMYYIPCITAPTEPQPITSSKCQSQVELSWTRILHTRFIQADPERQCQKTSYSNSKGLPRLHIYETNKLLFYVTMFCVCLSLCVSLPFSVLHALSQTRTHMHTHTLKITNSIVSRNKYLILNINKYLDQLVLTNSWIWTSSAYSRFTNRDSYPDPVILLIPNHWHILLILPPKASWTLLFFIPTDATIFTYVTVSWLESSHSLLPLSNHSSDWNEMSC